MATFLEKCRSRGLKAEHALMWTEGANTRYYALIGEEYVCYELEGDPTEQNVIMAIESMKLLAKDM